MITCVAFMGGDANPNEVANWADYIKNYKSQIINHKFVLRTAWYSGRPHLPESLTMKWSNIGAVCQCNGLSGVAGLLPFDYVKLGPYIESLGGLKSPTTNQRLYKRVGDEWQDITSSFWRSNFE